MGWAGDKQQARDRNHIGVCAARCLVCLQRYLLTHCGLRLLLGSAADEHALPGRRYRRSPLAGPLQLLLPQGLRL